MRNIRKASWRVGISGCIQRRGSSRALIISLSPITLACLHLHHKKDSTHIFLTVAIRPGGRVLPIWTSKTLAWVSTWWYISSLHRLVRQDTSAGLVPAGPDHLLSTPATGCRGQCESAEDEHRHRSAGMSWGKRHHHEPGYNEQMEHCQAAGDCSRISQTSTLCYRGG